jgi:hypothetical protein
VVGKASHETSAAMLCLFARNTKTLPLLPSSSSDSNGMDSLRSLLRVRRGRDRGGRSGQGESDNKTELPNVLRRTICPKNDAREGNQSKC